MSGVGPDDGYQPCQGGRTMKWRFWIAACLAGATLPVHAMGLLDAFMAAREYDPEYRAAWQARQAGLQEQNIARSQLLPQANLTYSHNRNWLHQEVYSPVTGQATSASNSNYPSYVGRVEVRQPVLNLQAWAGYRQGQAQSELAEAEFDSRHQQLMLRLYEAYSRVLLTRDQLAIAEAQQIAYDEQMRSNERLYQAGEGTRTDMIETRSRYDVAVAQVIEARGEVGNALRALVAMVGPGRVQHPQQLHQLVPDFTPLQQPLDNVDTWVRLGLSANAEVVARRLGVKAADANISRQRAGHYPTVDVVAAYTMDEADSVSTINQHNRSRLVGVQVRVPLYAGGGVSARTTQAVAQHERALAELDATANQVEVELRRQYDLLQSNATKIRALERAVESATLLVEATRRSVAGGVRVNLDVLNAEQQLYTSRRDLAQARYDYLDAYMRLRYYAGVLSIDDLEAVAQVFAAPGSARSQATSGAPSVVRTRTAG